MEARTEPATVFERPHHRRIAAVLNSLDADLLRSTGCWFGGGTAIALRMGEYRESLDIDFLVAELRGYRDLRQRMRGARDLQALTREGCNPVPLEDEIRIDRYGLRAFLQLDGMAIKFEIVSEGRIGFDVPRRADQICGVATLTAKDMAATKLLANADRWRDDSVFSRDAIDLAMLDLPPRLLRPALEKAVAAYGATATDDMQAALSALRERPDWLARCLLALSISLPPAAVQQKLRHLARRLTSASSGITA